MKKMACYLCMILLIISCSSPEKKTQQLVKKYLSKHLDNFDSYESIEFLYFDSTLSNFEDVSGLFRSELRLLNSIRNSTSDSLINASAFNVAKKDIPRIRESLVMLEDSITKMQAELDMREVYFKPEFNGWRITHTFRAKNALGNYVLEEYIFHIYDDFSGVRHVYSKNDNGYEEIK